MLVSICRQTWLLHAFFFAVGAFSDNLSMFVLFFDLMFLETSTIKRYISKLINANSLFPGSLDSQWDVPWELQKNCMLFFLSSFTKQRWKNNTTFWNKHCVKNVQMRSFFLVRIFLYSIGIRSFFLVRIFLYSVRIRSFFLVRIYLYWVQIQENTDQKNLRISTNSMQWKWKSKQLTIFVIQWDPFGCNFKCLFLLALFWLW